GLAPGLLAARARSRRVVPGPERTQGRFPGQTASVADVLGGHLALPTAPARRAGILQGRGAPAAQSLTGRVARAHSTARRGPWLMRRNGSVSRPPVPRS